MAWRQKRTVTPARLAANRRSALRSTGPRTAAGKARSRLNALRNGKRSKSYDRLLDALLQAAPGAVRETAALLLTPEELSHPVFASLVNYFCELQEFMFEQTPIFRLYAKKFGKKRTKPKTPL